MCVEKKSDRPFSTTMAYCTLCQLYFSKEYSLRYHQSLIHHRTPRRELKDINQEADDADRFLRNCTALQKLKACTVLSSPINYAHFAKQDHFELEENLPEFMQHLSCVFSEYLMQNHGLDKPDWPDLARVVHLYDLSDLQILYWELRCYLPEDEDISFYAEFESELSEFLQNETKDWVNYFSRVLYSEVNTLFWSWQIIRSQWAIVVLQQLFGTGLEHIIENVVLFLLSPLRIMNGKDNDAIFQSCQSMVMDVCGTGVSIASWLAFFHKNTACT